MINPLRVYCRYL